MVTPELQQVTTRSKSKQSEWEVQEAIGKSAKEWVEEANKKNASRMLQDMEEQNLQNQSHKQNQLQPRKPTTPGRCLRIAKFSYLWQGCWS